MTAFVYSFLHLAVSLTRSSQEFFTTFQKECSLGFKVRMVLANLFFWVALYGQAPDTLWTRTFGGSEHDWGFSVQQTSDEGYIIAGGTASFGAGGLDVWLIKTDPNGDTLWTKTYGGTDGDYATCVRQTSDGGYIITGPTGLYGESRGDVWLLRTDANGDTIWTKTFGGIDNDYGNSVEQTSDGGYIITGTTDEFYLGSGDLLLIKTDALGNTLWTKIFGGTNPQDGQAIKQTTDGGYIIGGNTATLDTNGFDYDIWLLKTDSKGDTIWTKTFEVTRRDRCSAVEQTADGGYVIAGTTDSYDVGRADVFLIKTDSNGDIFWTKTFGGEYFDWGNSVQQTSDGGYIIAGQTYSYGGGSIDIWLIRTNASGDLLWTKTFGGPETDEGGSVRQTSDGGYIIAGETESPDYDYDVWLIKTAPETPQGAIPSFRLQQNYPNPFNSMTRVRYSIFSRQFVSLDIYDLLGKHVATLVNAQKPVGDYTVEFNPINLASGIYFYQLKVGDFKQARKMILIK